MWFCTHFLTRKNKGLLILNIGIWTVLCMAKFCVSYRNWKKLGWCILKVVYISFCVCFVFIHDKSFHLQLWIQQHTVFTENGCWKHSWAHTVISTTESCLFLMHCCRHNQRLFRDVSLAYTDFSRFFESFNDIRHYEWWKHQSLLEREVLRWNLSTQSFTVLKFILFF